MWYPRVIRTVRSLARGKRAGLLLEPIELELGGLRLLLRCAGFGAKENLSEHVITAFKLFNRFGTEVCLYFSF